MTIRIQTEKKNKESHCINMMPWNTNDAQQKEQQQQNISESKYLQTVHICLLQVFQCINTEIQMNLFVSMCNDAQH